MGAARIPATPFGRRQHLQTLTLLRRLRDPAPPVAGLLCDVGGVLYDDTVWLRWLFKLVTRLGLNSSYTPFFRVWQREYLQRVSGGELEYWPALRMFLRAAGLSPGQIDEVEAAGHARRRECEADILPLPGVVRVLTCLRDRGIRLAVFSSGHLDATSVHRQLAKLGIDSCFDTVLASPDVARDEPGTAAVEVAIAHSGIPPRQLCYVGRDTAALAEAQAAGIRTAAVNYDDDAEADIYLGHFEQLLDAMPWHTARAKAG